MDNIHGGYKLPDKVFLTDEEVEMLKLLAAGWLTKQIAVALGINPLTVIGRKNRLLIKLDIVCIEQLIAIVYELGLTTPEETLKRFEPVVRMRHIQHPDSYYLKRKYSIYSKGGKVIRYDEKRKDD